VRMCARLSTGSTITASAALAESFAILFFLPPMAQLDVLIKVREQKLVLQYCIDHHSEIFKKRLPPLSSTPLSLTPVSLNTSGGLAVPSSPTIRNLRGEGKKKKSPGFKRSLTGSLGARMTKLAKKTDSQGSSPSGDYAKVFSLRDNSGKKVLLSSYVAMGCRLVLFFYS